MGDINFVQEEKERKQKKRKRGASVEYTSGEIAPTVQESEIVQQKGESSFSAWRRRREEERQQEVQHELEQARASELASSVPHPHLPEVDAAIDMVGDNDDFLQTKTIRKVKLNPVHLTTDRVQPAPVGSPVEPVVSAVAPIPHLDEKPPAPPKDGGPVSDVPIDFSNAFDFSDGDDKDDVVQKVHDRKPKKIVHDRKPKDDDSTVHLTAGEQNEAFGGVNLIPAAGERVVPPPSRPRQLFSIALGSFVVVLVVSGGLRWFTHIADNATHEIEQQITTIDTQITALSSGERGARLLDAELNGLDQVLAQHTYWTPVFEEVEERTLPTVYYESMSGNALTGVFTFNAITSDYAFVEPQVELFRQSSAVESVNASSASALITSEDPGTDSTVSFSMTVHFNPELFHNVFIAGLL